MSRTLVALAVGTATLARVEDEAQKVAIDNSVNIALAASNDLYVVCLELRASAIAHTACQHNLYAYLLQVGGDARLASATLRLRSPSTVHSHLKILQEGGYLEKDERKTRALSVKGGSGTAFRSVPVLGTVTAGLPILAQEDTLGYVPYDGPEQGEMFALQVRGESMLHAGILDGDIVLVRRQNTAMSGQIVVAMIGEEATVKRLAMRADGIWLMPENPAFDPIDGRECVILGLVVSLYRPHV